MDFNVKLQELRKNKGITQEELANVLYVSRAAVTKWESGKGYPNIDSLKSIAKYFNVTIDDLLSTGELLCVSKSDNKKKERQKIDVLYGIIDICNFIICLFPVFGQKNTSLQGMIEFASLFQLNVELYVKIPYIISIVISFLFGVLILCLQSFDNYVWVKSKYKASIFITSFIAILFILSNQPYPAGIAFLFLIIKVLMLIKW